MIFAFAFSGELSGFPALVLLVLIIAIPFYLLVYLPIKLITIVIARANQKADRLRLLHQRTIIAEYDPPDNLSPAEMGYMFDSKLTIAEVFATIVSFEQQGFLTITEEPAGLLVTTTQSVPPHLKEFERYVLDTIREQSGRPLTLAMLEKITPLADVVINKQLREQGYLVTGNEQLKRSFFRLLFITATLMLVFPILAFRPTSSEGIIMTGLFLFFFSPGYFIFSFFVYKIYKKIAGEPWLGTPKLKQVWSDIEGYRHFIEVVEADRLKFDSETTKGIIHNKALPYAIALGFNTGWLKKLH